MSKRAHSITFLIEHLSAEENARYDKPEVEELRLVKEQKLKVAVTIDKGQDHAVYRPGGL